LKDEKNRID
jgi:hypothetical protein